MVYMTDPIYSQYPNFNGTYTLQMDSMINGRYHYLKTEGEEILHYSEEKWMIGTKNGNSIIRSNVGGNCPTNLAYQYLNKKMNGEWSNATQNIVVGKSL